MHVLRPFSFLLGFSNAQTRLNDPPNPPKVLTVPVAACQGAEFRIYSKTQYGVELTDEAGKRRHAVEHRGFEPRLRGFCLFLVALDDDFVVIGEYGEGAGDRSSSSRIRSNSRQDLGRELSPSRLPAAPSIQLPGSLTYPHFTATVAPIPCKARRVCLLRKNNSPLSTSTWWISTPLRLRFAPGTPPTPRRRSVTKT